MRHYYNKNIKKLLIICPILNLQGCKYLFFTKKINQQNTNNITNPANNNIKN